MVLIPHEPRHRKFRTTVLVAISISLLLAACTDGGDPTGTTDRNPTSVIGGSDPATLSSLGSSTTAGVPTSVTDVPITSTSELPADVVTVGSLLATDLTGQVTVAGYLFIEAGTPRLCESLIGLDPPACGGMSISVAGDVDVPQLQDFEGILRWSAQPVFLSGSFSGSKLAADGPPLQYREETPPTTELTQELSE